MSSCWMRSCAKTLIGRRARACHVAVTGACPAWPSIRISSVDDDTQQSDSAVDLQWRVGGKLIHFVGGSWEEPRFAVESFKLRRLSVPRSTF